MAQKVRIFTVSPDRQRGISTAETEAISRRFLVLPAGSDITLFGDPHVEPS